MASSQLSTTEMCERNYMRKLQLLLIFTLIVLFYSPVMHLNTTVLMNQYINWMRLTHIQKLKSSPSTLAKKTANI